MAKLQFKFAEKAPAAARTRVLGALEERGAKEVHRLFPDSKDGELAALYVLTAPDSAAVAELLAWLNAAKEVDFAEEEAHRKLVR